MEMDQRFLIVNAVRQTLADARAPLYALGYNNPYSSPNTRSSVRSVMSG
jgi:hypothetical protein